MEQENTVEKTVQPGKNGGTLKVGNPGNSGGGRRPSHIRERCRASLETVLGELESRVQTGGLSTPDLLRAADLLAKYGVGPATSEDAFNPAFDQLVSSLGY